LTAVTQVDEKSVIEAAQIAFILTESNNDADICCHGDEQRQSPCYDSDLAPVVKATVLDRF